MIRQVAGCALAILLSLPAVADKVTLKDGRTYEGKLVREGATDITLAVVIMGKTVEMTVPLDQIEKFERTDSLLDQYETRAAKVNAKDPDALVGLAAWCRDNKLPKQAAKHLLEALALKPDHAVGIKMIQAMGYIRKDKTWIPKPTPEKKKPTGSASPAKAPATAGTSTSIEQEIAKAQRDLESGNARLTKLESDLNAAEKKLSGARTEQQMESAQQEVERVINEIERALQECETRLKDLERLERMQQQSSTSATPKPAGNAKP